jgi:hypothetical protein
MKLPEYFYQPTLLLPKSANRILEEQTEIGNDTIANIIRNISKDIDYRGKGKNPISKFLISVISDIDSLYESRRCQGFGHNGKWSVRVIQVVRDCLWEKLRTEMYLDDKELVKLKKKKSPEAFYVKKILHTKDHEIAQDAFIRAVNSDVVEELCHSLGYSHIEEKRKDADRIFSYFVDMERFNDRNTVSSE